MELDQEKLTRNESERSRELAQRIRRELGPCSVQVLGGVGALESALDKVDASTASSAKGIKLDVYVKDGDILFIAVTEVEKEGQSGSPMAVMIQMHSLMN